MRVALIAALALSAAGCASPDADGPRLPTGARLDPAAPSIALGSMPLAMAWSPDSTRLAVLLCGYREQGVQIVDPDRGVVTQTLFQPAAFLGLAFSPDGRWLYASGGARDVVYRYAWNGREARLADSLRLDPTGRTGRAVRYPAGLAPSPDGRRLYVAENLGDSLAVVDAATGRVEQRLATGRYPYAVAVSAAGRVFVSAWGGAWVASFEPRADGLAAGARITVGRHPSALALARSGERLFVARASEDAIDVVDTRGDSVIARLSDAAPAGPAEGVTPDALALSADGRRLFVAEADANAAAIFELSAASAGGASRGAPQRDRLLGRVPVEWYPTDLAPRGDSLFVLSGKGRGTAPNPRRGQPGRTGPEDLRQYALGQTSGSLTRFAVPGPGALDAFSRRVARAEGWDRRRSRAGFPPFEHVLYVIRENRTYDQVLGDEPAGDGDTSLVYFGHDVTPNAHALAERFGLFDRFFVNADVSGQGHNWSTAAYSSDYVEKTIPSQYSGRRPSYDYEGLNRDAVPVDDVAEPGRGYLWDSAARAGTTLRDYGEFTRRTSEGRWVGLKPSLAAVTDPDYPGWDLATSDQRRADAWLADFRRCVAADTLPALMILRLPNDHTAGATAGAPTPRAYVADNDLALGRIVEALSRTRFWRNTVVFVLEDDAQDGPDHVDSHRSVLLVISAWNRPGVVHRFANTTDVLATIDRLLGLGALSNFDRFGRPLLDAFAAAPDPAPYRALRPQVPAGEVSPDSTRAARLSRRLDFRQEDRADEALFNRVLWWAAKGEQRPYPAGRPRTPWAGAGGG